jgi:hypothetical protein
MEFKAINKVFQSLEQTKWGWRAVVPGVTFLERPLELRIDTRSVPTREPPPMPDEAELALASLVLLGLDGALAEGECPCREYHYGIKGAVERAHEPRVWLSREVLAKDGPGHWTLAIGIARVPDYGTHIEFQGLSCKGIWSGD